MTINEIQEKVNAFLTEELEINPDLIMPEARLKEDMGVDSLEIVDVIVFVDETFGFKMKPEDFKQLATYGQFCDFIAQKVG